MSISYPTAIDNFDNPTATTNTTTVSHADQHANANDAIEALEAKVGVNSSAVATSLDYKVNHITVANITDLTASAAELNKMDGVTASTAELNILDGVTSTAAELNILDGVTSTAAELNVLDGITASTAELNKTDGVSGDIVGTSDTQTLTNKRITKRVGTVADSATPTPDADSHDIYTVTALAQAATFGAPTGTPTNGQPLILRIKDNGTARAIDFNAIYRFSTDLAKPTTTVLGKTLYMGFLYNSADSKWDCVTYLNNF